MDPSLLIGDIVERDSKKKPPTDFSDPSISSTGFPQHKRRWKTSAFKQRRTGEGPDDEAPQRDTQEGQSGGRIKENHASSQQGFEEFERRRIDQENRQKINDMTDEEIAQAKQDLMGLMNPDMIQKFLRRSNIDDDPEISIQQPRDPQPAPEIKVEDTSTPAKRPTPEDRPASNGDSSRTYKKIAGNYDEDSEPPQVPPDLFPITDPPKSTHFPAPPRPADLDPSDPNFLQSLHEKYFPDLPADPSKLAWMAPVPTEDSVADRESPYYPHPEIAVSALRFNFRGRFLSPVESRSIAASKGLHNHGEAPEAAGYTIAELSRLARSAVPAQRCMAFQTLGRILYRLGRGRLCGGQLVMSEDHPISTGVWDAIKQGRVVDSLTEAATVEGGHRGSKAYATEALWLFQKGGWKEKFKGR